MRYQSFLTMSLAAIALGCIPPPSSSTSSSSGGGAAETQPSQQNPSSAASSPAGGASAAAEAMTSSIPGAGGSTEQPAQPTERVAAEAGVGKKGRSLDDDTGIVVEPVKQLFAFEEKAVFDLQIKPALNLYKASNGSLPKTHEEFMEKIVKANNIQLPELPAGQRYVWDPEKGKLMVERPAH